MPRGLDKTALLSELKRRWKEEGAEAPIVVEFLPSDLNDPVKVVTDIAMAVDPEFSEKSRTTKSNDASLDLTVWGMGLRFGGSNSTLPPSVAFDILRKDIPAKMWKRPVCLMVDEIQSIRSMEDGKIRQGVADTLLALHRDGLGLPIVPVFAGLGDSQEALKEAHLTRIVPKNIFNIGALRKEEAMEAVEEMLKTCGISQENVTVDWPPTSSPKCNFFPFP